MFLSQNHVPEPKKNLWEKTQKKCKIPTQIGFLIGPNQKHTKRQKMPMPIPPAYRHAPYLPASEIPLQLPPPPKQFANPDAQWWSGDTIHNKQCELG